MPNVWYKKNLNIEKMLCKQSLAIFLLGQSDGSGLGWSGLEKLCYGLILATTNQISLIPSLSRFSICIHSKLRSTVQKQTLAKQDPNEFRATDRYVRGSKLGGKFKWQTIHIQPGFDQFWWFQSCYCKKISRGFVKSDNLSPLSGRIYLLISILIIFYGTKCSENFLMLLKWGSVSLILK